MVLSNPLKWEYAMMAELLHPRYSQQFIRVHDSGDFFAEWYTRAWIRIATRNPDKVFYAYTKQVEQLKKLAPEIPQNFRIIFSLGGLQDHLIDKEKDRHCDVFHSKEALEQAGYHDNESDDRLAAVAKNIKIGIVQNNIRHLKKKLGKNNFSNFEANSKKSGKKIEVMYTPEHD